MRCFKPRCLCSKTEEEDPGEIVISKGKVVITQYEDPPASERAKAASMDKHMGMADFLREEECISINSFFIKDQVTVNQFLQEEAKEEPKRRSAQEKKPKPEQECIVITELTESPGVERRRRAKAKPMIKSREASKVSLPIPDYLKDFYKELERPHILKQSSAPLLKYIPFPEDQQDGAVGGTKPPPSSPQVKPKPKKAQIKGLTTAV